MTCWPSVVPLTCAQCCAVISAPTYTVICSPAAKSRSAYSPRSPCSTADGFAHVHGSHVSPRRSCTVSRAGGRRAGCGVGVLSGLVSCVVAAAAGREVSRGGP
eukprot:1233811-Prymnesium_polylepis.1